MNYKSLAVIMLAFAIFLACLNILISPAKASNLVLYPSDDSYVDAREANSNYGNLDTIIVRANSSTRRSYLKFNLGSIPAYDYIVSATLKLYCTIAQPNTPVEVLIYSTTDSWNEGTITWNNAPALGSLVGNNTLGGTLVYYSWNITEYIRTQHAGDKIASVIVKFEQDDPSQENPDLHRNFRSKEYAGTDKDPYLEIVTVQQYYLTVGTNPPGITTIPGQGWYANCTYVSLTAPTYVPNASGVNGERYRFDHWRVDGTPKAGNPISVHMNANHTAIAYYVKQFKVVFSQSGVGSDFTGTVVTVDATPYTVSMLPATFWWDKDSVHNFAFASPLVVDVNKQYVWVSTSGLSTAQSGSLTITATGSVTGNYVTYYRITFSQSSVGSDFTGTIVTVDAVNYGYSGLPVSFMWQAGSVHSFSFASPLMVAPNSKQYLWTSTTGLSSSQSGSITVSTSGSVTGNYKTQYYLTLDTNPPGVASPSGSGWHDANTYASISTPQYVDIVPGSSRHRFSGWTTADMGEITNPSAPSTTVLMDKAKTVTANYAIQYYLTLTTNPPGVASLTGTGWYDANAYAPISAPMYVDIVLGSSRYSFNSWTTPDMAEITDPSSPATTVLMDKAKTVTANYVVQYNVTFAQSGVGSDAVGTVVTVDGTDYGYSLLPASFWWNTNANHTFSFASPIDAIAGKRYVWVNTTGLSNLQSGSITVTSAGTITGNYKTQYYLAVSSSYDTPTPTSNWFDSGTSITASVTSPWAGPVGTRYVCTGWAGTGSVPPLGSGASVAFTITAPSSITWNWKTQYLLTVNTNPFGLSPQPSRNPLGEANSPGSWWYDAGTSVLLTAKNVTGYTFTYWDVDGFSQGIGANPIAVSMNASHTTTAHYVVPVGGHSFSLTKQFSATQLFSYPTLMAILGAAIAILRRKKQ